MKRRKFGQTICLGFAVIVFAQPAAAVCLERDPHSPGGIVSVGPRHVPIATEYQDSKYVIVAKVISAKDIVDSAEPDFFAATEYTISPTQTLKGNPPKMIVVESKYDSGRFSMDVGNEYVLFLRSNASHYFVDNCGYSDLLSAARATIAQLTSLVKPAKPVKP